MSEGTIQPGAEVKGIHIKLLDKTLMKMFADSGRKPLRLRLREIDAEDESHFSVDLSLLAVEEELPPGDEVVDIDRLSAFELHFDFDLATFLDRTVAVLTSSATRLFNALFVPFLEVECVVAHHGDGWKIVLTEIVEREPEKDQSDFEEIQY